MSRKDIISASLNNRGAIIVTRSIEEACKVADTIAPEHLELSVQDADKYIDQIHHAGALFVGPYTCEALGDYCAGPNHVLPTSAPPRYSSPLGVWDFQKRMSVLKVSKHGSRKTRPYCRRACPRRIPDGPRCQRHVPRSRSGKEIRISS